MKLLEDLFIYTHEIILDKKSIKGSRLSECACFVDKSENNKLQFFEEIYAESLASIYKKTHIHYFGNAGSPSKNAFDCIYFENSKISEFKLETMRELTDIDIVKH